MTIAALGLRDHLTHRGNLKASRYGWLRLTPMYSVHLVDELLDEDQVGGGRVLDPFCGTGTTALVCAERGIACDTTDINPFLVWLSAVKAHPYTAADVQQFSEASRAVATAIVDHEAGRLWVPGLSNIDKWWDEPLLDALSRAWGVIHPLKAESPGVHALLVVSFLRTAIKTAHVTFGHQSMSFRPRRPEADSLFAEHPDVAPEVALAFSQWHQATEAIAVAARSPIEREPRVIECDARDLTACLDRSAYQCVITSPPYCNRMSYIRELRPYMYWTGHLQDGRQAGELDWLAMGGTWGCATSNVAKWEADGEAPDVPFDMAPVVEGIRTKSDLLARYVEKYFHDAMQHLHSLSQVVAPGGMAHYIVGNSKFYDTMVPVEEVYGAMLREVGFEDIQIKTIRKRTSKKELFEYVVSGRRA